MLLLILLINENVFSATVFFNETKFWVQFGNSCAETEGGATNNLLNVCLLINDNLAYGNMYSVLDSHFIMSNTNDSKVCKLIK